MVSQPVASASIRSSHSERSIAMSKSILTRAARSGGGTKINRTGPNPTGGPKGGPKGQVGSGGGGGKFSKPPIMKGSPNLRKTSPDAVSNIGRSIGDHASDAAGGRSTVQRPNE